jgi:hypothetical protein
MRKINILVKLVLSFVFIFTASACSTAKLGESHAFQGKIWRGYVTGQFWVKPELKEELTPVQEKLLYEAMHFKYERDQALRGAIVTVKPKGFLTDIIVARAIIPDNVEYSELTKGAIVDFIFQRGTEIDLDLSKINRIIRVVCAGTDRECIKRVEAEGSPRTVIDDTIESGYLGGNTYTRQVSSEERAKYGN